MPLVKSRSRIIAGGMLRTGTPVEDYKSEYGLWVKREDLSCVKPGPAFSKTRGVYARVKSREEQVIGVLDTRHSQAGHAVARACQILGKQCVNYYPEYKHDKELRQPQLEARELGAELVPLPAGRSCILFHQAKKLTEQRAGYMMPNALKLEESVSETAKEVPNREFDKVVIPISSGTIAAGVVQGFAARRFDPLYIIHLGYSRSHDEVVRYIKQSSGVENCRLSIIDEGYAYKDQSLPGATPPWPCNSYYDLKAFRWWLSNRRPSSDSQSVLFWNIG